MWCGGLTKPQWALNFRVEPPGTPVTSVFYTLGLSSWHHDPEWFHSDTRLRRWNAREFQIIKKFLMLHGRPCSVIDERDAYWRLWLKMGSIMSVAILQALRLIQWSHSEAVRFHDEPLMSILVRSNPRISYPSMVQWHPSSSISIHNGPYSIQVRPLDGLVWTSFDPNWGPPSWSIKFVGEPRKQHKFLEVIM